MTLSVYLFVFEDQPSDDPDDVQDSFAQEVALMADVAQLPDFVKVGG